MRLALLAVVLGCNAPDLGDSEQAIVGGTLAPDEAAVVGLARHAQSCAGATVIDCSATLVAPRAVVTAAHCISDDPPNVYQVFFGAAVGGGGVLIPVAGGRTHPDFDPATFANDIAVLILAQEAPSEITPIAMRMAPLPDLAGSDVTVVGFGITAVDSQDTGVRFSGTARVTAVGMDEIDTAPGPAITCQGDSGGPVLAAGELIGVTTHGDAACAQVAHAQRVDRQQAFIAAALADVGGTRRAFDADAAFCDETCATDADCPADTMCFAQGDGSRRCVYHGLPAGTFAESCPATPAACVTVPDGSCRRFVACSEQPPDDGCGCSTGSPTTAMWWWLVVAFWIRTRASRRAGLCAARTASTSRVAAPRRSHTSRR